MMSLPLKCSLERMNAPMEVTRLFSTTVTTATTTELSSNRGRLAMDNALA
nr:hypothetical protein [uncultured Sphaerochaeta sp.]